MDLFFQQLVNGLSLGALYALIAVGYTVVYGIIQLINFAHGEIFMIGAFGALTVWLVVPGSSTAFWMLPLMLFGGMLASNPGIRGCPRRTSGRLPEGTPRRR